MSRYGIDSALWGVYTSAENARLLLSDPASYLARFPLSDTERDALAGQDYRALLQAGAHPFLMYKMALRINGGFSLPFVMDYVGQLEGLELGDIVT
jgi:serine/threonine protein kinase HipA of HipAB toxin-antitoxin module